MSCALRSRRSKRNTDRKTARPALFDPAVFLETTEAPGDSRHHGSVKRGCRLSRRCNVVIERSFSLKPSAEKLAAQVRKKGRDSGGQ
jgi:hypothetical protein